VTDIIEWNNLGFCHVDTGHFVAAEYRDGRWSPLKQCQGGTITLSVAATCLHYGQACFEGLKAFRQIDGSVAAFRPDAHARRLIKTAHRLAMIPPNEAMFVEAVRTLLKISLAHIPPVGSDASFYIRPLLIGTQAVIGVQPSNAYVFLMFGMPVGPYYHHGLRPVSAYVHERYDRAAPRGVGHVKAAGNYAAGLVGDREVHEMGYDVSLYLDSATHTFVDEFGTSNFMAITGDGRYVTPRSESILESVTNISLQTIAADLGLRVERRPVPWSELDSFAEVAACGTAAVITPIHSITRGDETHRFGSSDQPGPTLQRLYDEIQGIQYGRRPDRHGWMLA
jgi:branched-chain amino acid aminotransferase